MKCKKLLPLLILALFAVAPALARTEVDEMFANVTWEVRQTLPRNFSKELVWSDITYSPATHTQAYVYTSADPKLSHALATPQNAEKVADKLAKSRVEGFKDVTDDFFAQIVDIGAKVRIVFRDADGKQLFAKDYFIK